MSCSEKMMKQAFGASGYVDPQKNQTTQRLPVKVTEIVRALEREAANTDTDPRWIAANELRLMANWETRTLMCNVDTNPQSETMTAIV